jgi:uncharacterized protein
MHTIHKEIRFSASDLVGHLNCRYLTTLDLAVAIGALAKPKVWDPALERGAQREKSYVEYLKANGLAVTTIDGVGVDADAVAQTLEAMKAGAPVIVQGAPGSGVAVPIFSDGWKSQARSVAGLTK